MTSAHVTNAITIRNLQKTYKLKKGGEKIALKGVDLDVPKGAFFGLLGPNGAGKSTLINILAGLAVKSGGKASVCGYDLDANVRNLRLSLGVVPQELVLDTFFTVREALDNHAGYYGVPKRQRRTDEIIGAMGLSDKADVHSRQLSGGMRRRLLIAKALVHNPPVLILDEPTAGVDVELRSQLWNYVRKLNETGTTILLTTHYLEEAQELCDTVAVMNHGEIVAHEKTQDLLNTFDSKQLVLTLEQKIQQVPAGLERWNSDLHDDGKLTISYKPSQHNVQDILSAIQSSGLNIKDISTCEADLEDVFIHLINKKSA